MTTNREGKRGRPLGFRLSEASKRAISISKIGQRHRPETKDKISKSLLLYFRNKNPLSEEITNRYCRFDDDITCEWVYSVQEELDSLTDIITEKALLNKGKIEITCGETIECFGHNVTPELILLFKEHCKNNNLQPEDALEDCLYG